MRTFAAVTVILGSYFLAAAADPRESTLLETGLFHGDEVIVSSTAGWLGLVPNGDQFELRNLTIQLSKAHDVVVDEPGEKTGTQVTVDGESPVFLVRGVPALSQGKVVGYSYRQPEPQRFSIPINTGEREYKLEVTRPGRQAAHPDGAMLALSSNGVTQVLFEWEHHAAEGHCSLLWAGDLDGDGALDLYMDLSDHYNVTQRRLFLSSAASDGELLQEVASFRTVGC